MSEQFRTPTSKAQGAGPWRAAWREVRQRRLARLGMAAIGLLALIAIMADFLASDLPIAARYQGRLYLLPNLLRPVELLPKDNGHMQQNAGPADWVIPPPIPFGPNQYPPVLAPSPAAPNHVHWLGTDADGRDVLARLIHGSRVSLAVGFVAVALHVFFGMAFGASAGYWGGRVDSAISRLIEIVMTVPTLFLVLAVMGMVQRPTIYSVMLVIGLTGWTGIARLVRAETLKLVSQDFVAAARAQGLRPVRVIAHHILPNALGPVVVSATFGVASAVIIEAALSFLGFGSAPPTASWGGLLAQAQANEWKWWLALFPGLAIFATVVSYNLVGEALRDALDPRLRQT